MNGKTSLEIDLFLTEFDDSLFNEATLLEYVSPLIVETDQNVSEFCAATEEDISKINNRKFFTRILIFSPKYL